MPDMLVLGQEAWDEVERRNQLLLRAFALRHPAARFLFEERPLRPRDLRSWRRPRLRRVHHNIWTFQSIRPLPGGWGQAASDRVEAAQVRWAVSRAGLRRPAVWSQDPRAEPMLDLLGHDEFIYDLTDDWAAFAEDPAARADMERNVHCLGARADLTVACSRPLMDIARAWTDSALYLPNAVEEPSAPPTIPDDLVVIPGPRLAYVGTLHSSRLDVPLLAEAASLRPAWSFVLLGPDMLDAQDRQRLFVEPNVVHLGVRPHGAIRGYLAGMDVCLIPHRITDFTESLDPLKLYEYLAAGRPVVATPVGIAAHLADFVTTAVTAAEFIEVCERLLASDDQQRAEARRAAMRGETWDARAEAVERALGVQRSEENGEVDVVIVNYNTRDLLLRSLASVYSQDDIVHHTIVVDNGSQDGSVEAVRARFPEVEVLELGQNAGFGPANNAAFARCRREFVLLVNSDAFLAPGAMAALVAAARRHPRAGAIGLRLLNPDGSLQRSAWPFPHGGRMLVEAVGLHRLLHRLGLIEDLRTWAHDEERSVDFLVGACLLLRREAIEDVGGFDEAFWLYAEEADLQASMTAGGWEVVFTPTAEAFHVSGASSTASLTRLRHFYAGQRTFLRKHGTRSSWPLAWVGLVVGAALRGRPTTLRAAFSLGGDASR